MRFCETCRTPYRSNIEFCGLDGSRLSDVSGDGLLGIEIDRYRLVERLGGGGMAAVYRAEHVVLHREVAVKILYGEFASHKEFAERFRREAQASSKIQHDNVVHVLDFGTTAQGASFLVMELLRGRTLQQVLHETGPLPAARAARVLRDIARGLAAAHAQGYIHRDLKPGNVMLVDAEHSDDGTETAKLVDFGLVAAIATDDDAQRLTQTGQTLGTPHYMAPEQIGGGTVGAATPRTDLYSLGAALHEMLAGSAPFHGSLADVLVAHASVPPPPLPPSRGLERIAAQLMEKDPAQRPESAQAVVALIEATGLVDQEAPPPPPQKRLEPAGPRPRTERFGGMDFGEPGVDDATEAWSPTTEEALALPLRTRLRPVFVAAALIAVGAGVAFVWRVARAEVPAVAAENAPSEDVVTDSDVGVEAVDDAAATDGGVAVAPTLATTAGPSLPPIDSPTDAPADAPPAVAVDVPVDDAERVDDPDPVLGEPGTGTVVVAVDVQQELLKAAKGVDDALSARGLTLEDAFQLTAVSPPLRAWQRAHDQGDAVAARRASEQVAAEVARARLRPALLRSKLARIDKLIDETKSGPKREQSWKKRLRALSSSVHNRLSDEECGRLMLRARDLERDVAFRRL